MAQHTEPPTTDELRAAFDRARAIRFSGWSFEAACASSLLRTAMTLSAIAHRRARSTQAQARLI